MEKCKTCGMEITDDGLYCPYCGTKIGWIRTDKGLKFFECFSKTELFDWAGRRNRKPFFWFGTFLGLLEWMQFELTLFFIKLNVLWISCLYLLVVIVLALLLTYLKMINVVKRGHDVGISGYVSGVIVIFSSVGFSCSFLLGFLQPDSSQIPNFLLTIFGIGMWLDIILKLYLLVKKGDHGSNKYGVDPFEHPVEKN